LEIFSSQDGIAVIPVSEYFESEIGLPVSPKSLHGIFLQRYFGGHGDAFDRQISTKLACVASKTVQRNRGKTKQYPIGTSALLDAAGRHFLVFALTNTDIITHKVYADVPQMFAALKGLWESARAELGGETLNIPLIGSGLAGIGLPTRDLVNIIILSFIDETKRRIVAQNMRIVLAWDRLFEIDLRELKNYWEVH
jgi:hypothetical protein